MNFIRPGIIFSLGILIFATMVLGSDSYRAIPTGMMYYGEIVPPLAQKVEISGELVGGQKILPGVASPADEIRAQGYLLRGSFPQVLTLLEGKISGPFSQGVLTKAALASGENYKARNQMSRQLRNPFVIVQTGLYLANLGDYQSAVDWISSYRERNPELKTELNLQLCQVLIKMGKIQEAAQVLQGLDQNMWQTLLLNGDLYLYQGEYARAWQFYDRVKNAGYLQADAGFLAKYALAAMGANQDWTSVIAEIRQQNPQSGLSDYLEAQGSLRKGDLVGAQAKIQAALQRNLPGNLKGDVAALQGEITARLNSEAAIQAVIAQGGH